MNRREFLRITALGCVGPLAGRRGDAGGAAPPARIMTVLGPIPPARLGIALPHEHVLVDFVGADRISRDRYDVDDAFKATLPHLLRVQALGCRALVECTPAYLGRDPTLLARLSRASGLHILTNTGYYGAASDRFVPRHALEEDADALAGRWTREWAEGIDGSAVRPGFIKTGVDAGPLSQIDRKLIRAAARTHLGTGLTIASHTGDTRAAREQLDVLASEGVGPDAFIWVHAQSGWDLSSRVQAARDGAWIEVDDLAPGTVEDCARRVEDLKRQGVLKRVLISHDAGWYKPGEPGGGAFREFDTLCTTFVPALRRAGWTASDIHQLLVVNPAAAFSVRVRRAGTTAG